MRTRDPFGTALGSLRAALDQGIEPGRRLPIADIAAALRLSASPVREALSRLCGEGLIEDRRGLGYFTRSAPQEDIVGLLHLEEMHVRLAAGDQGDPVPGGANDEDVEAWVHALMETCTNQPLVESYDRVRRRFDPMRRLHGPIDPASALPSQDGLKAYYDRWRSCAAALSARLRRMESVAPEYTTNRV
jgi:DNA-binding GntR family transcriptional regulator